MHAYLFVGDKETRDKEIDLFLQSHKRTPIEFPIQSIKEVRELQQFVSRNHNGLAFILTGIDTSSPEAQNALLKIIEEPSSDVLFLLPTESLSGVIETIQSRCSVIVVKSKPRDLTNHDEFINGTLGKRLHIVSKITVRDEAIEFVTRVIEASHLKLYENPKLSQLIKEALKANSSLKQNSNVTLTLSNMVIQSQ